MLTSSGDPVFEALGLRAGTAIPGPEPDHCNAQKQSQLHMQMQMQLQMQQFQQQQQQQQQYNAWQNPAWNVYAHAAAAAAAAVSMTAMQQAGVDPSVAAAGFFNQMSGYCGGNQPLMLPPVLPSSSNKAASVQTQGGASTAPAAVAAACGSNRPGAQAAAGPAGAPGPVPGHSSLLPSHLPAVPGGMPLSTSPGAPEPGAQCGASEGSAEPAMPSTPQQAPVMGWGTTGLFTQRNQKTASPAASDATTKISSPSQKDEDSDCPAEKPSSKKRSGKGVTVQLSQHLLQTPPRKTAFRADAPEFVPGSAKDSPDPLERSTPPPRSLRLSEMECLVTPTCKALQRLKEMNSRQPPQSEAVETSRQWADKRALLLRHRQFVLEQPEVKTPCHGFSTQPVSNNSNNNNNSNSNGARPTERPAPNAAERHSSPRREVRETRPAAASPGANGPFVPLVTKENAEAGARLLRLVKEGISDPSAEPNSSPGAGSKVPIVEAMFNKAQEEESRKGSGKGVTRSRIRAHAAAVRATGDQRPAGPKQILSLDSSICQVSNRPSEEAYVEEAAGRHRRRKGAPGRQGARGM